MHQELGIRYGSSFQNSILPFSRMLYLLRIGRIDLISSQGHKAALEVGEKLSIQHKVKVIAVTKRAQISTLLKILQVRVYCITNQHLTLNWKGFLDISKE